jgi:hypothetical protein
MSRRGMLFFRLDTAALSKNDANAEISLRLSAGGNTNESLRCAIERIFHLAMMPSLSQVSDSAEKALGVQTWDGSSVTREKLYAAQAVRRAHFVLVL